MIQNTQITIKYHQHQIYQYKPNKHLRGSKGVFPLKQSNNYFFAFLRSFLNSRILFIAQIRSCSMSLTIIRKTCKEMQHWCFNCNKITFPKAGMKCQYCFSEAIEDIRDENNPAQYIPFSLPAHPASRPQPQAETSEGQERNLITITFVSPMALMMPPFLPMSFIRILNLAGEEGQNSPVDDEKYQKLQKIGSLEQECAVCQERSGSGVKLGCRHEFHEDCIKPWFKNANTCPCCRATV